MIGACRTIVGTRDWTKDVFVWILPPAETLLLAVETILVEYSVIFAYLICLEICGFVAFAAGEEGLVEALDPGAEPEAFEGLWLAAFAELPAGCCDTDAAAALADV